MALVDSENELEFSNQPDEDEEYVCLPILEKAEQEDEEEEELVFFPTHGGYKPDETEGMDTEQQDLCQGSRLSNLDQDLCCVLFWSRRDTHGFI